MKLPLSLFALGVMIAAPAYAQAKTSSDFSRLGGARGGVQSPIQPGTRSSIQPGKELPAYLQCVPYAREFSGIGIYGDAHSWWDQAKGRYKRGRSPKIGAVMAFRPHRNMKLGHVAAVSKVINRRTILLSHSNWSPINGRRGQIEHNVRAVDVSPNNDWSAVRVWYHPLQALGKTAWPVAGFIYGDKAKRGSLPAFRSASSRPAIARQPVQRAAIDPNPSPAFSKAFGDMGAPDKAAAARPARPTRVAKSISRRPDPVRDIIARYEN